jgi:ABC-type nitrate/sulfonate/bicarbonate transport system permease component
VGRSAKTLEISTAEAQEQLANVENPVLADLGDVFKKATALPLGLFIGAYRPLRAFFEPLLEFARYLPAVAFVPVSVMPAMFDTLRITLGWAWTYLVVAELVAANSGLGYAILKAQRFLQTDRIFVGIIVIGLIGLGTDQLLRWAHRQLFPWAGTRST